MTKMGFSTLPISWVYGAILKTRHFLYDTGMVESKSHDSIFSICIGNLNLGGSGKTPLTEFVLSELQQEYKVAVVSRGYGRKTKGFYIVDANGSAEMYGDEPLQMAQKFTNIPFAVCENRSEGIAKLLEFRPDLEVILLDDAFQHRKLKADLNILLTPFARPFFRDYLIPSGGLRDVKTAASRADLVVISKSPAQISHETKKVFQRESGFILEKDLFFAHIDYASLWNPFTEEKVSLKAIDQALVVTGLANPTPLEEYLKPHIAHLKFTRFRDHHQYSTKDIKSLKLIFDNFAVNQDRVVITTEKDFVKFEKLKAHIPNNWTVLVAPIKMLISDKMGPRFIETIKEKANIKLNRHDG